MIWELMPYKQISKNFGDYYSYICIPVKCNPGSWFSFL